MAIQVRAYGIGCEPSPSVPAETVLQDGWKTFLLFFAVSKSVGSNGRLDDLGVAVMDCRDCASSKFGYPNDEGMPEHPLYSSGIAEADSSILEVIESPWAREVSEQMAASSRRIWGGRGMDSVGSSEWKLRHFIIALKEATFECLASSLAVERFCESFDEAFEYVLAKFAEH